MEELHTEEAKSVSDAGASDPSSAIARILEVAKRQLEEEFRHRLDSAVQAATAATHSEVTAELRKEFDQTLLRTITQLQSDFEKKIRAAREQWDEERNRIQQQSNLWRSYAEAQRLMAESNSQTEILSHFLQCTEVFAPNFAVYIARADGLGLWKTRGDGPFPNVISQNTSDPDAFFKPIVVRGRTIAAISARPVFDATALGFLASCLERAIDAFGLRLQNARARAAAS